MKNKIKIFRKLVRCASIALLSFSMAGCGADFLDTTPTNNISGSSIWTKATLAEQAVIGVYNVFLDQYCPNSGILDSHRIPWDAYSSVMDTDKNWIKRMPNCTGAATPSSGLFSDIYKRFYTFIYRANDVIDNIGQVPDMSTGEKQRAIAECKFLRAFAYMRLNILYKGVPLYMNAITSPENELSETYHVSRVTVRKALAGLSELGYLDRKSGKGTFVAEKKLHRSITEVISFTDMCRMMNATAGAKTIKIALEEPSEREIKEMSLKPGEKILVLERIRYMDDEPVIIELNKFPESFSFLFGEDLNDTSLFEVLKKHNIILDHSRKTLDIIFASPQEAKALNINKGYPLLRIKSTIHDVENTITNLCQQLCIGDKFTFIV